MIDTEFKLNTIEEALTEFKNGNVIIVVDDEDRENEGDFICAAEKITPEIVNFMASVGRGLICVPLLEKRASELGLNLMVDNNTAMYETAFTVSVDLIGHGCTTGISTYDRAQTIKALADYTYTPSDFSKPGHIFPLIAKQGGVLRRTGHTEASIDLCRLSGLHPVGALVEILNEDGSMARLPQLVEIAEKYNLKIISIKDLISFRLKNERLIEAVESVDIDSYFGNFKVFSFRQKTTGDIHFALVHGDILPNEDVMVKVYSHNLMLEAFRTLLNPSNISVNKVIDKIKENGSGVVIFMHQRDKDHFMLEKLKKMEQSGKDFVENDSENRDFGVGAQILLELGVKNVKLISSNPVRKIALKGYGLDIKEIVALD